jgi:hypothetical protein
MQKRYVLITLWCCSLHGTIEQSLTKLSTSLQSLGRAVSGVGMQPAPLLETFNSLVGKSNTFNQKTPFPTQENRISFIAGSDQTKRAEIEQHAQNVRPLISASVIMLLQKFLVYKKGYGSSVEKSLYAGMDENVFIDRLLINRPLMFMTASDDYLLRDGSTGSGGFESIGTDAEQAPLLLKDYLSYDEMQIAALVGISVPTYFINNGSRDNKAIPGQAGTFEEKGIYVGLVGARFEKPGLMEWQHMIVNSVQNSSANGYGLQGSTNPALKLWSDFYGEKFPTFQEARNDASGRYIVIDANTYLDSAVYKKRLKCVIEPFLIDAHERGKAFNKNVYCHAVGLGLGVWQVTPVQAKLMLEVYEDVIRTKNLSFISDIDFSWFPAQYQTIGGIGNLQMFNANSNQIKIHFSKRNPADLLTGNDAGKLLVAMYAWDGNAYPGNEYWQGMLDASGDPAAACCSTIPELQNPLINSNVSSRNLFVVG